MNSSVSPVAHSCRAASCRLLRDIALSGRDIDDLRWLAVDERRPQRNKLLAVFVELAAAVCALDLVTFVMCQGGFDDVRPREVGPLPLAAFIRPCAERCA